LQVWYTGYLGCLAVLWSLLLAATLMAMYIPVAMIHDAFVTRLDGRGRRFQGLTLVGYFSMLLLAALLLPPWVPLVICLLALGVNLATTTIPTNPHVQFLWRYRNGDGKIRSIPWGLWVTCYASFLTVAAFDLVLMAAGSTVFGERPSFAEGDPLVAAVGDTHHLLTGRRLTAAAEIMPITTSLGLTLAWLAPSGLLVLMVQTVVNRTRDPARPSRPSLFLKGSLGAQAWRSFQQLVKTRGWQLRASPQRPEPLDVPVELVETAVPVDWEGPRWPLPVTLTELQGEEVWPRLARRNEIQLRRRLLSGLERLFKQAAARTFRRGSGLWVAPHLWFIPGLSRDTPEEELDLERGTLFSSTIGLPYYRVLPHGVRHHAYLLFRALQIDLIFVEDGVTFKRLTKVFRVLFETYDMHGGRRRAEEVQFQGLPGTRVVIHDFQLDEPYKSKVYPEPEFENLARARILHVFKDRGEQEEPVEDPLDFTRLPAPSAAY